MYDNFKFRTKCMEIHCQVYLDFYSFAENFKVQCIKYIVQYIKYKI